MSGFEKQTYTQVPNSLFTVMKDMDECELKVVLLICRYTFGYHRDEIKLSTRKMADEIGMNTASVAKGAEAAVARGLIEKIIDGNKTTVWRALVSDSESEPRVIQNLNHDDSENESLSGVKERIKKSKDIKGATKPAAPRANDFPSNVLYREVTERYPSKANWHDILKFIDSVSQRLGRPATKDDLAPFYSAWCGMGWNSNSINWLEYAVKGVLPGKGKPNANYQPSEDYTPAERELAAQIRASRGLS
jgi:DNA-binding transcriptional MocR family regulator